jgi:hypothetical protein
MHDVNRRWRRDCANRRLHFLEATSLNCSPAVSSTAEELIGYRSRVSATTAVMDVLEVRDKCCTLPCREVLKGVVVRME